MTGRSLRARVALAAALGAAVIVAITAVATAKLIAKNNTHQIDRRLTTVSRLVLLDPTRFATFMDAGRGPADLVITVRGPRGVTNSGVQLPRLPRGRATVLVDGTAYRVLTKMRRRDVNAVSLGLPVTEARARTSIQRRQILAAGLAAIVAAAGLGWLFGGRALRPIVRLTDWVRRHPQTDRPPRSGVREADELSDALASMQQQSTSALQTAQNFALAAAHELRTPLTALRTDLDVLGLPTLDAAARDEVVGDLLRTHSRIDQTLTALERLAVGEFTSPADRVPTDLGEICALAAADAERAHPGLTVTQDVDPDLIVNGFPAGLRLVLDNALTNAGRHGTARNAWISAHRQPSGSVTLAVDDDGSGVPADEREQVFGRFVRGTGSRGGSGLGLALIAQQAGLHGGRAWFENSVRGGARLVVELAP